MKRVRVADVPKLVQKALLDGNQEYALKVSLNFISSGYGHPLVYSVAARVHEIRGNLEEALDLYNRSLEIGGGAPSAFAKSRVLWTLGRRSEAAEALNDSIMLDPRNDEYREALRRMQQSLGLFNESSAEYHYTRSIEFIKNGELILAEQSLRMCIDLDKSHYQARAKLDELYKIILESQDISIEQKEKLNPFYPHSLPTGLDFKHDRLSTIHASPFMSDQKFINAWMVGRKAASKHNLFHENYWRVHINCWAAQHGSQLHGDFVEIGVSYGVTARTIVEYIGKSIFHSRRFWLVDAWLGTHVLDRYRPEELQEASHTADRYPQYCDDVNIVKDAFSDIPSAITIQGFVPEALSEIKTEAVAYCHLDLAAAEPEMAAIEWLWQRMTPGAICILNNYGYGGDKRKTKRVMFDEFAKRVGVGIAALPTGQGMLIRPPYTP